MSNVESDEWEVLDHWILNNDIYEYDSGREPDCNYGLLEEYMNYINIFHLPAHEKMLQTDLLLPIKSRK